MGQRMVERLGAIGDEVDSSCAKQRVGPRIQKFPTLTKTRGDGGRGTYGNPVAIVLADDPTQPTRMLTAQSTNLHRPLARIQEYPQGWGLAPPLRGTAFYADANHAATRVN
jgi:hypothetical protein